MARAALVPGPSGGWSAWCHQQPPTHPATTFVRIQSGAAGPSLPVSGAAGGVGQTGAGQDGDAGPGAGADGWSEGERLEQTVHHLQREHTQRLLLPTGVERAHSPNLAAC